MSVTIKRFDPEVIFGRALKDAGSGRLHAALDGYKRAFQYGLDPRHVRSLISLFQAFIQKGLWREAETCLLEALRVDPYNSEASKLLMALQSVIFYDIRPYFDEETIRKQKQKTIISNVPLIQLFIEVTNRCNGRCITCLNRVMKRERGIMDFELFRRIVDESSKNMYLELVHLYGVGEAYLVPHIKDFFDYAIDTYSRQGIKTVLITNGERITDLPEGISFVDISFNGGRKETYERITGLSFDRTVRNIWRLEREGQLGPNVNIHMLVFDDNESEVEDFKRLFAFTSANLVLAYKYDNQCGEIEDKTIEEFRTGERIPCHYVRNVMNICWNGDVILCPHDFEGVVNYGNVKEMSLSEIWHSDTHREMLRSHSHKHFEGLCKLCNFNVPIEGKNIIVSRQERIRLRKEHLDFALKEIIGCRKAGACEIVQNYRQNIERMEGEPEEPLIRICSDDIRFYGLEAIMDPTRFTYCDELKRLRQKIRETRVVWEAPTFGPSGYAFAAQGYMMGLADIGLRLRTKPIWGDCKVEFDIKEDVNGT